MAESMHKTGPLGQFRLDYEDVEVHIQPEEGGTWGGDAVYRKGV